MDTCANKIILDGNDFVEIMKNIPIDIIKRFAESYGMLGIDDKVAILKQVMILPSEDLYIKTAARTVELCWMRIDCLECLNRLNAKNIRKALNGNHGILKKVLHQIDIVHVIHNIGTYRYYYGIDN